jgi:hypothetical protein
MRVRVNPRTQVNHEGKVYEEGQELDVPGPQAASWLKAGWVSEAKTKKCTARNKKKAT